MLDAVWAGLGGRAADLAGLVVEGPQPVLPGPLASDELAIAAVGSALVAAAELAEARVGHRPDVHLETEHVADAVRSERFLRIDGASTGSLFDPLSSFNRTADGWVRLHANYPHHRAALCAVLGLPPGADPPVAQAQARIATWAASDLEDALASAGGVGAMVRTPGQWLDHPAGQAAQRQPLVRLDQGYSAGSAWRARVAAAGPPLLTAPARGFRVLDLTRVIAGPVGTRTLAATGAEVLRIDPPQLPELPFGHMDTGPGKWTALLDLRTATGLDRLHALLAEADAFVHGYRPGALEALGLTPAALAERHPHLVTAALSAWGEAGPWAGRRGFDSIVQAASGIADVCRTGGEPAADPGTLPAQLLDHATGHLMAATVLRGLTIRETTGVAVHAHLTLAGTAAYLMSAPHHTNIPAAQASSGSRFEIELDSAYGRLTQIRPPGRLDGIPLSWAFGAHRWGGDEPHWPTR